ncbi:MAG TPA: YqiA/YcfP family alpha/beta fold hydrolase [Candidatus Obscuribacterales bacterium]
MGKKTYLYLHGFASSPASSKAQYLRDRFASLSINLKIPDLNQGDFSHLTLTRQLQQIPTELSPDTADIIVIGSSFGGLTAARLAEQNLSVKRLILLAPAFNFLSEWFPKLGEEKLNQWQTQGYLSIYHYAEKRDLPLHYQFLEDLALYPDEQLRRQIPTLILHGINDEVIPIQASRNYLKTRPWVKLVELNSDHSLENVLGEIWQEIRNFLENV